MFEYASRQVLISLLGFRTTWQLTEAWMKLGTE